VVTNNLFLTLEPREPKKHKENWKTYTNKQNRERFAETRPTELSRIVVYLVENHSTDAKDATSEESLKRIENPLAESKSG
jgi:hypothetical protein